MVMAGSSTAFRSFTVRRKPEVLVTPAGPTPRELKLLSDIDDQGGLRFYVPVIHFYRCGSGDPAAVLRDAIARALVQYYPFAGRLRELEGRKLAVECTGEGVLFIEADADISLDYFGHTVQPPFPGLDQLMYDVPGSDVLLDAPLFHFQVTRLTCGGFVLGVRMQHVMADGAGLVQFLNAVGELARGAMTPTVRPVWERELLMAPLDDPPMPPRFAHREYDDIVADATTPLFDDMTHRSFFFGAPELAAVRSHLPPALRHCTTNFEVLTGCLWKCRTAALAPADNAEMRMICIVNLRGHRGDAGAIPRGYYGNAFAFPVAVSSAGDLRSKPLGYAVEVVMKAKREVDLEYMRSVARLMARRRRPQFTVVNAYLVSDVTKIGLCDLDYGWGKPVFAGPAKGGVGAIPGIASFLIAVKNAMGEDGISVPVCLPGPTMNKFSEEMSKLMRPAVVDTSPRIISAM
uniref:Uncharacterized protein n=1 Tax=Avena sativa TaxID=4498 RepID=A0ACD5XVQ0_AVESA